MDPKDKPTGWFVVVPDDYGAGSLPDGREPETSSSERALLFRLKAEEARTAARAMVDPGARAAMLQMADTYQRLARHVADRDASQEQRPPGPDAAQAQSND